MAGPVQQLPEQAAAVTVVDDSSPGPFEGQLRLIPLPFPFKCNSISICVGHRADPIALGGPAGPEKLLEIWFAPSEEDVVSRHLPIKGGRAAASPNASRSYKERWTGLRQVEKAVWDNMLDEVQCKVLSVIEGEEVDAYLLR